MPCITLELTDADAALLARVQRRLALPDMDAAAEWLLKARLQRAMKAANGRGRSLYMLPRSTPRTPTKESPCA